MADRARQNRAVALRYRERDDDAPRVVARGRGRLAERIREIAEQHGIPLHRDDDLLELLAEVDLDREIPVELYAAVAEVLSWIYRANGELRKETGT